MRTTYIRCTIKVGSLFFFPIIQGTQQFHPLPHQALTSGRRENEKKEKERERGVCGGGE